MLGARFAFPGVAGPHCLGARLASPGVAGPHRLGARLAFPGVPLTVRALAPLPDVRPGDDLAALLAAAAPPDLVDGDVLAVAHKVVSKAEGRVRLLDEIAAGERARALAAEHDKDPRLVQAVLDESVEVVRARDGVLVCETRHGFVCANAGVDRSNASRPGELVLLPEDPDASARRLREGLAAALGRRPAVVVTDSFGRAWRLGQTDVAIGAAGLVPLDQWIGRPDAYGRELRATSIGIADAVAAAADLARTKISREPAILIRGLDRYVTEGDGPGAAALRRPREQDLFR
jgi:coenzyme F420-0:L-glutamate ligase/coenzyme F420-1:gamma-L-glutamate ligase